MYAGIYIETLMNYTRVRSLMVVEQIDLTPAKGTESGTTIYTLLKKLKPLLLDGFANRLSSYRGQISSIGIYVSDVGFNTFTNYTGETFFMVSKSSDIFTVQSDTVFPTIDDIYKMDFNNNETRRIFSNDQTINAICDIERDFWASTKNRADTIKLLKQFEPDYAIKWYNWTSTLKRLCRKHMRHKIINILAKDIKGERHKANNDNNTSIV